MGSKEVLMSNKNIKRWPEDYVHWNGDLQQLVATSNEIVKGLGYEPDLTERTVRHYQHKNMVGRGIKKGKQAYFDVNDLSRVVATKTLVKQGWTLDHASDLLTYQTQTASLTCTPLGSSATPTSSPSPAVSAVAELLALNQSSVALPATRVANQLSAAQSTVFSSTQGHVSLQEAPIKPSLLRSLSNGSLASSSSLSLGPHKQHIHPSVSVEFDPVFWASLSDQQKETFRAHLSHLSTFLSTLPTPKDAP